MAIISREVHWPGRVWPNKTYFSHLSPVYMYLSVFTVSPDLSLDHSRARSQPRQKIMWQSRCFYFHQSSSVMKSNGGDHVIKENKQATFARPKKILLHCRLDRNWSSLNARASRLGFSLALL